MTAFAAWQERMRLQSPSACAQALGISRQSVDDLRKENQKPHPSTRRLLQLLEWLKDEHGIEPRDLPPPY